MTDQDAAEPTPAARLTIDELSRAAGTTTRNVRAYQTRGLLPPPRIEGRVGYYGAGHLARLRLIATLQEQGFSLAAISHLVKAWDRRMSLSDVLGFEQALTAPWAEESAVRVSQDELRTRYAELSADPRMLGRAVGLGLLIPEGDGFRVPNPAMLRIGARLVGLGIPLERAFDEFEALRADTTRIARRFVDLFEEFVWGPFVEAGMPGERVSELTEALNRLRPMASEAVGASLAAAMEDAVAETAAHLASQLRSADSAAS